MMLKRLHKPKGNPDPERFKKSLWISERTIDVQTIDFILEHGLLGGSSVSTTYQRYGLCKVALCPGKSREDLLTYFSRFHPCPNWDAFIAAESAGFVKITATEQVVYVTVDNPPNPSSK